MKNSSSPGATPVIVGCFMIAICLAFVPAMAQVDVSLHFKGSPPSPPQPPLTGDYIELNNSPIQGNSDFTVEAKFTTVATAPSFPNFFRRLFVVSGQFNTGLPFTRFEVGEAGGDLVLFWSDVTLNSDIQTIPAGLLAGNCYHIAVVRQGASVRIYLDGALLTIPPPAVPLAGLNSSLIRVGHWHGSTTPEQDWEGTVDDFRVWNTPLTLPQILDYKDCAIGGTGWPNLVVNWTFDQAPPVVPGGDNTTTTGTGVTTVLDMSGNGNDGTLVNFTLNGPASNFILSPCPPLFSLDITDLGSQSISLANICSGNGAHFCVNQNGISVNGQQGLTGADWQYWDIGISTNWTSVTDPLFTGFCFGVPTLDISAICASSSTGYVDRIYRAVVTKGSPPNQYCTYITSERQLRIYCPVTNVSIAFAPPIPAPPNVALCEGTTYTTTVSLNSTDAFVPSGLPPTGNVGIQWCINGTPDPNLDDQPFFPYSGQPAFPDLCFEAKVSNGVCPLLTATTCIPVDKVPMCGIIDATPKPLVLMNDPNGGQYDYLICPGNDAELMMLNPLLDFKDCDAVWQIMFPITQPGVWIDLNGIGNPTQNTGTLPQSGPPSPWVWPQGEICIVYRIECRPKHHPHSDCAPCHSNEVQICLKQPKPAPVVLVPQNLICAGSSTTLSVSPYDPNCSYTWYCNGIVVGTGPTYDADKTACYWVEVFDGCFVQVSDPVDVKVCEIVPIIECPQDNPCACLGLPITLDGSNTYNTCGVTGPLPLIFSWTASSPPFSGTGPLFVHTPDPNGTTYTLTVTDPNLPGGCSGTSKPLFIKPCQ
mgnify:CR=1 FL=1